MSMSILPPEIVHKVFENLQVYSLRVCRTVCRQWRDLVDDFPKYWRDLCFFEYRDEFIDAGRRAGLPWRSYYQSLRLWPRVATASVKIQQTNIRPCIAHQPYQLLPNGIIGCPQTSEEIISSPFKSYLSSLRRKVPDMIVYYDLATLEEYGRLHCKGSKGPSIHRYTETQHMVALVDKELSVYVILKANYKTFCIGRMMLHYPQRQSELAVLETEVYFKNSEQHLISAQLAVLAGDVTVHTTDLGLFLHEFSAVSRVDGFQVNFLVKTGIIGLKDGEFRHLDTISAIHMDENINTVLETNGFMWNQPEVLRNLSCHRVTFEGIPKNITLYRDPVVCSNRNIVILATTRSVIHIFLIYPYKCPHEDNPSSCSSLDSDYYYSCNYRAKLVKTIDFKRLMIENNYTFVLIMVSIRRTPN